MPDFNLSNEQSCILQLFSTLIIRMYDRVRVSDEKSLRCTVYGSAEKLVNYQLLAWQIEYQPTPLTRTVFELPGLYSTFSTCE